MTNFSNRGFLADNFERAYQSHRDEWGAIYKMALEVSDFAWTLQRDLRIENTNVKHLVGATLFARSISVAQAFLLLVPRGMKQELKILTRCLLEPLFPLLAAAKDEEFARKYVGSGEIERKKKLQRLLELNEIHPIEGLDPNELRSEIQQSQKKIKENGIVRVTVFDAARVAGLEAWYKSLYSLMSDTLHASPKSLEELMVISADRTRIEALQNLPDFSEHPDLITTVIDGLLHAIMAASDLFDLGAHEFVEEQSRKIRDVRATSA